MRKIIIMLAMLFLASTCALALGKITVDPNTPEAKAKIAANVSNADLRCAQKITYKVSHRSVVNILADLSKMTGIKLSAGYNSKDWQVRDRKMNIFSKDALLSDLMSSIARVMKFKWDISGEGEKTAYRLCMDRKALLDAETQALRQEEKYQKQLTDNRESMLTNLGDVGKLSPQELDKLKSEKPYLYLMASSGVAELLDGLMREVPSAAGALASGQEFSLRSEDLTPSAQQKIHQWMQTLLSRRSKLIGGGSEFSLPMDKFKVELNTRMEVAKSDPAGSVMLGDMRIRYGDTHLFYTPLLDPNSKLSDLIAKASFQSREERKPLGNIMDSVQEMNSMQDEYTAAAMLQIKEVSSGEPVAKRPEDAILDAKIKLKLKETKIEKVESALADASGLSVVSDSFGVSAGLLNVGSEEIVLRDALEKIAEGFFYNWDKRSSILEFRDRNWFRKRNAQIPQAWIDAWKDTIKRTGTLDINDLAQIAMLTQEQFNVNIMTEADLVGCGLSIYSNSDLLRIYAGLTEAQRTMVFAQSGLDMSNLTAEQWTLAEKTIARRRSDYLRDPEAHLNLAGTVSSMGRRFEYNFTVSTSGDMQPIKWTLFTPKYQKPPKEQPKTTQDATSNSIANQEGKQPLS